MMKRIIFIAMFLLILISPIAAFGILEGDVDNSGKIDLQDAIMALRISSGMNVAIPVYISADVNDNQKIDLAEAIYALQCVARLRNNHSPVLSPVGNKTIDEGSTLNFTLSATDEDNDPLTFSATPLPNGATFNAANRTFSWTPAYSQSGTYQVTFTADDGYGGTASETINIVVNNKNRAPVLTSIGNKTIDENSTLTFSISATDADGDTIIYSVSTLPNGATFNTDTKTFSWTPTYSQSGPYPVTFTVRDDYGGSVFETITITVNNKIPVFRATEYFPLNIGDWQDFKYTSTGLVHRSYTTGPRYIGGIATKERTYWNGQREYYTSDANGVKMYGQYTISPNFTGDVYFNSPLLLMPDGAQVGMTQVSSSSFTISVSGIVYHVNITSTTTGLGLEDVQTEHMILRDCIKVSIRLDQYIIETGQSVPGNTVYYWFYKGVGCVKQVVGSDTYTITGSYINGVQQTY